MIEYYKHTTGNAFTLNGNDYYGFFHVDNDGRAYTGKRQSSDMEELVYKPTFIADFYKSRRDFDNCFASIEGLTPYNVNNFDILNKEGMDQILNIFNDNNIVCFKGLSLPNPTIYDLETNDFYFNGIIGDSLSLSAINSLAFTSDIPSNSQWSFLNYIVASDFDVDAFDNFKYYCATDTDFYVLQGNFTVEEPFTILEQYPVYSKTNSNIKDYIYSIYNSEEDNKLYIVKKDSIEIYDNSQFNVCQNQKLVDVIELSASSITDLKWGSDRVKFSESKNTFNTSFEVQNPNNPEFIRFGNNLRTYVQNNILYLYGKNSNVLYSTLALSSFECKQALAIDIRDVDDLVCILFAGLDDNVGMAFFDPQVNNTTQFNPNSLNTQDQNLAIVYTQLYNLESYPKEYRDPLQTVVNKQNYKIHFCYFDSNIIQIDTPTESQTRSVTNPLFPLSKSRISELFYPSKYTFGNFKVKFGEFFGTWNYKDQLSNSYNTIIKNDLVKNDSIYTIIHNFGRVHFLKNQIPNYLFNLVPLDLIKNYNGIPCSESSIGLYFNNAISNIIKDTLLLYSKSYGGFTIQRQNVIVRELKDILKNTNDLYLNGNETINTISLQRIFDLLYQMQEELLPITSYALPDPPAFYVDTTIPELSGTLTPPLTSDLKLTLCTEYNNPPLLQTPYFSTTGDFGPANVLSPNNQTAPKKLRVMINAIAVGPNGNNDSYYFSYYNCVEYCRNVNGWILYNGTDPRMLAFGKTKKELGLDEDGGVVILKWNPTSTVPLFGNVESYNPQVNGMWELTNGATPSVWSPSWSSDMDADIFSLYGPTYDFLRKGPEKKDYRPPFKSLNVRDMEVNPNGLRFYAMYETNDPNEARYFTNSLRPNGNKTSDINKKLIFNKLGNAVTLNSPSPKVYGVLNEYFYTDLGSLPEDSLTKKRVYSSVDEYKNLLKTTTNYYYNEPSPYSYKVFYEVRIDLPSTVYITDTTYPLSNYNGIYKTTSKYYNDNKYQILGNCQYKNFDCSYSPYYLSKEDRIKCLNDILTNINYEEPIPIFEAPDLPESELELVEPETTYKIVGKRVYINWGKVYIIQDNKGNYYFSNTREGGQIFREYFLNPLFNDFYKNATDFFKNRKR